MVSGYCILSGVSCGLRTAHNERGDNMLDIGTEVKIEGWPTGGKVIGHYDGIPIIQPNPCLISGEQIHMDENEQPFIALIHKH